MTDEPIPSLAEAMAEFRREREPQPGDTLDSIVRRVRDRVSAELHDLRACIVELGTGDISDAEIRRRLGRLAERILVRKAAYEEWRRARLAAKP